MDDVISFCGTLVPNLIIFGHSFTCFICLARSQRSQRHPIFVEERREMVVDERLLSRTSLKLLDVDFPIEEVSEACAREKSIRQGHISTLQQWWARRPLGVCRSAIFAALCPSPEQIEESPQLTAILNEVTKNSESVRDKINALTARLSTWEVVDDENTLGVAYRLLMAERTHPPLVADTFAGGGSFPVEALRLG
jgi:putative DNA methylase